MSTYRVKRHWGVTIVRKAGNCDCPSDDPRGDVRHDINQCGLADDDELLAVVVNAMPGLTREETAQRICALLNGDEPGLVETTTLDDLGQGRRTYVPGARPSGWLGHHRPERRGSDSEGYGMCTGCGQMWPCPGYRGEVTA